MIVVDIESTGLDPDRCSILSIWAINFNYPEKKFYQECKIFENALVEEKALEVNWFTYEQITNENKKSEPQLISDFVNRLTQFEDKTIAWQHPMALDIPIIKAACKRAGINYELSQRTVDLHSIAYSHFISWQKGIPLDENWTSNIKLDYIASYLGIWEEPKPHNALNWAKYEAECFARLLYWKNLLEEFKDT